jgi:hypothetical protein
MVKDVKMCKSAGEATPINHGKKQKGGKKPANQPSSTALPAERGADNP